MRLLAAVGELKPYGRKVGSGGRSISAGDGHEMSWHSSKRMALNAVPGWRCTTTNTEDKTEIFVRMLLLQKSNSSNAAEKYFETEACHLPIYVATWHHPPYLVCTKAPVYKDSWISYRLKWPSYFLPREIALITRIRRHGCHIKPTWPNFELVQRRKT